VRPLVFIEGGDQHKSASFGVKFVEGLIVRIGEGKLDAILRSSGRDLVFSGSPWTPDHDAVFGDVPGDVERAVPMGFKEGLQSAFGVLATVENLFLKLFLLFLKLSSLTVKLLLNRLGLACLLGRGVDDDKAISAAFQGL